MKYLVQIEEAPRKLAAGFDAIDANLESPAERKINADSTLYPHILGADSQKACDEFTYGKSQGKPEAPQVNRRSITPHPYEDADYGISSGRACLHCGRKRGEHASYIATLAPAKPAHTPRPWKIDENEELPLAVIQDNEDGEGVCEIGKPGSTAYSATPEQWANARLIAAAPTMLQALKDLTAQIQLGKLNIRKDFSLMNAHAAATKAIFQAEGE